MRSTEVVSKKRLGENEQTDLGRLQGTGVAASVGGTAPLSGAGALIVDAISQSCHVDGLATCSVSVLGAEDEEQATHCYKASGKSNSSSVSAKPPMSPGRVKTLEDHDQILAAIILAHGQDTCPRSLMILHKILPRFCPRFLAKNITLPKILGQELLAGRWLDNEVESLWSMAKSREVKSKARSGMMGKACQVLLSGGIAPNNESTWQQLKAKHPNDPTPVAPDILSDTIFLKADFDILSVLRSFPKGTAAGPSGLRVQHLLDVATIPLHTPICTSLRCLVNLLAGGRAPPSISKFLADGNLVALNKTTEASKSDIRPIAVGGLSWMNVLPSSYPGLFGVTGPTLSSGILKVNYMYALNWQKLAAIIDADDECIDLLFHAWYLDDGVLAELCTQAKPLLQCLQEMAVIDLQVAVTLLRVAGSYCRMVHLAHATPPNLASDALKQFDKAAQLGLRHGGLGLRSLSLHAPAISSGHGCLDNTCLQQAVTLYNAKVSPPDALTVESVLASPPTQKALSSKIDMNLFHGLLENASPANKARLLSESASHAAAWLSVVPSIELGLHLEPYEYQVAVWWWLGLDTSGTAMCPFCPEANMQLWISPWLHYFALPSYLKLIITLELKLMVLELRKLNANSTKCTELGWTCIPWLLKYLVIGPRAAVVADIYGRLNIILSTNCSKSTPFPDHGASRQRCKQHCVVEGCPELYCTLNVEVPHDAPCTASLQQKASSVFSRMTHLKADDKACAKAGLDLDGTKRRFTTQNRRAFGKSHNEGVCTKLHKKLSEFQYIEVQSVLSTYRKSLKRVVTDDRQNNKHASKAAMAWERYSKVLTNEEMEAWKCNATGMMSEEKTTEDFKHSWTKFHLAVAANNWEKEKELAVLPALLRGKLVEYYVTLEDDEKDDPETIISSWVQYQKQSYAFRGFIPAHSTSMRGSSRTVKIRATISTPPSPPIASTTLRTDFLQFAHISDPQHGSHPLASWSLPLQTKIPLATIPAHCHSTGPGTRPAIVLNPHPLPWFGTKSHSHITGPEHYCHSTGTEPAATVLDQTPLAQVLAQPYQEWDRTKICQNVASINKKGVQTNAKFLEELFAWNKTSHSAYMNSPTVIEPLSQKVILIFVFLWLVSNLVLVAQHKPLLPMLFLSICFLTDKNPFSRHHTAYAITAVKAFDKLYSVF
eukprot:Em0003g1440a